MAKTGASSKGRSREQVRPRLGVVVVDPLAIVRAGVARLIGDLPDMQVLAEAGTAERVMLVPGQALQLDQAGAFVLVVDGDNKVQMKRVEIGVRRREEITEYGARIGRRLLVSHGRSQPGPASN